MLKKKLSLVIKAAIEALEEVDLLIIYWKTI